MKCKNGTCGVSTNNKIASELIHVAKIILQTSEEWLTADDVEVFCASCANKMRKRNIKKIKASVIGKVIEREAAWEKLPKGWTKDSLKKYWETMTGDVKHKVTKCIKVMKDKMGDKAGAFCASLADKVDPGWRSRKK